MQVAVWAAMCVGARKVREKMSNCTRCVRQPPTHWNWESGGSAQVSTLPLSDYNWAPEERAGGGARSGQQVYNIAMYSYACYILYITSYHRRHLTFPFCCPTYIRYIFFSTFFENEIHCFCCRVDICKQVPLALNVFSQFQLKTYSRKLFLGRLFARIYVMIIRF